MYISRFLYSAKLRIIILLFSSFFIKAQEKQDTSEEFSRLMNKPEKTTDDTYNIGKQLLKIAENNAEYSIAYYKMADGLYKKENYSLALQNYKKVDSLSDLNNEPNEKLMANLFKSFIYQKVGLNIQAEYCLGKVIEISETIKTPLSDYMAKQQKAIFLEEKYKFCEAIPLRIELVLTDEKRLKNNSAEYNNNVLLINSYSRLAFDYIKCGQLEKAEPYIKKTDNLVNRLPDNENYIISVYFLTKAVYFAGNRNKKDAKCWFDKAFEDINIHHLNSRKSTVLVERINANIDGVTTRKSLIDEYQEIKQKYNEESIKILRDEELEKSNLKKRKIYTVLSIVLLFLVLLVGAYLLFKQYKKKNNKQSVIEPEKQNHTKQEDEIHIISKLIEIAKNNETDFYNSFAIHFPNFNKKLVEKAPDLSITEIRTCKYIKLRFTTKEIAIYTKSSIKAVESRKLRARKKLNLSNDKDFILFINNL